jgi:hypothetical protein
VRLALPTTLDLEVLHCAECGVQFGLPQLLVTTRRGDHASFHCPNGHANHFPHESEAERLRRQLHASELEATRRANELASMRKEAERLARRARAGVCPCCNRTFKALAAHMARQHPEK